MSADQRRPDVDSILSGLKDFQRKTVDYVYRRLYEDPDSVNRFLIADEVGLGKTLVAKGVVARAVDRLWNREDHRIDVVYICSNADIARQNVNRLNLLTEDPPQADRLTMLPTTVKNIRDRRMNFVAFTPGTSFMTNYATGKAQERALIYWILREGWGFGEASGPKNLLQAHAGRVNWRDRIRRFKVDSIDRDLAESFLEALKRHRGIRKQFEELSDRFRYPRKRLPQADKDARTHLIGKLRTILAEACARFLEPDIVILDEFQRFKNLLDGEDEAALLAGQLFNYPGAKTLLLSATPYKMYTMYHESESEDHYEDFIRTVEFLLNSKEESAKFQASLAEYRRGLLQLGSDGASRIERAKGEIEATLRKVMVRTERVPFTSRGDAMVEEVTDLEGPAAEDLTSFVLVDRVARELGVPDTVEYWKSAPYLLNMMDSSAYKIKRDLVDLLRRTRGAGSRSKLHFAHAQHVCEVLHDGLVSNGCGLLPYDLISEYRPVEPANAKIRTLMSSVIDSGGWHLLWVPASMPYYSVKSGPYSLPGVEEFTKALVFSAWQVVPKAIAILCSYEAERRMISHSGPIATYAEEWRRRRAPIRFPLDRSGRPGGMSALTLLYPCLTLALRTDPLRSALAAREAGQVHGEGRAHEGQVPDEEPAPDEGRTPDGQAPDLDDVVAAIAGEISELTAPILEEHARYDEPEDDRWYWAALALLDHHYLGGATLSWVEGSRGLKSWASLVPHSPSRVSVVHDPDEHDDSNFGDHVRLFAEFLRGEGSLGRPPRDLAEVLARIAIGSPAVAAARALCRVAGDTDGLLASYDAIDTLLHSSGMMAFGFRTMFNLPETIALLRGYQAGSQEQDDSAYWQLVLEYCVQGNLQAVMDEYSHVLRESLGLVGRAQEQIIEEIGKEVAAALSIRTVPLTFDEIQVKPETDEVSLETRRVRCRFALRFGDEKDPEDTGEVTRADQVRRAFNSPFRPFILATTSIGQEGLDFHQYCHCVYHWNLPSNPVDLEQREGRVHRYKGHAIRRNVAKAFGGRLMDALRISNMGPYSLADPWQIMFDLARESRKPGSNDLVPYWICEEGGYRIRRHIPAMPLSRELGRMEALRKTLVAYRMVFGQPRQEDLVGYLAARAGEDIDVDVLARLRVDLGVSD